MKEILTNPDDLFSSKTSWDDLTRKIQNQSKVYFSNLKTVKKRSWRFRGLYRNKDSFGQFLPEYEVGMYLCDQETFLVRREVKEVPTDRW